MSGLHFDFTGNPAGLVDAANRSRIAIEGVTKEAETAGVSVDKFLGASKDFITSIFDIVSTIKTKVAFKDIATDVLIKVNESWLKKLDKTATFPETATSLLGVA